MDVMTPATGMSKAGLFRLYLRLMVAVNGSDVSCILTKWSVFGGRERDTRTGQFGSEHHCEIDDTVPQ